MGGCLSRRPPEGDSPQSLAKETQFSVSEVQALQQLFKQLSNKLHKDNLMHKDEFSLALFEDGQRSSLFTQRLFDIFDSKQNDVVDFGEFVRALSVFHPRAPLEEKARVAFQLYDLDNTGVISRGEVRRLLGALLTDNPHLALSEADVEAVISRTFEEVDVLRNGVITPAEWLLAVRANPEVVRFMTIPELRDVSMRYAAFLFKRQAAWEDSVWLGGQGGASPGGSRRPPAAPGGEGGAGAEAGGPGSPAGRPLEGQGP